MVKVIRYGTSSWEIAILCLLVAVLMVRGPSSVLGQTSRDISADELSTLLKGLEETTAVLEYDADLSEYKVSDGQVNFAESLQKWENAGEPTGVQNTTHFLLEYGTGRINFTREAVAYATAPDREGRFLNKSGRRLAFDGATRMEMQWSPDDRRHPGFGLVSNQPLEANKELSSFEAGMDVFLPFYQGVGLRRYLSSDRVDRSATRARLGADGVLEVSYVDSKYGTRFGLRVDLQKDGAILEETHCPPNEPDKPVVKTENTWEKDSQGNWIPRSSVTVQGTRGPFVSKQSFKAVKRNHLEPKPEMFRLEFPARMIVNDYLTGMGYVVGVAPAQLVNDVTATVVETRRMSGRPGPADANGSIPGREPSRAAAPADNLPAGAGVRQQDVSGNRPAPAEETNMRRPRGLWVLLGAVVAVGAFLAGWALHSRKSRRNSGGAALLLLVVLVASPWSVTRAEMAPLKPVYGWNAPGPGGTQIPIYQCGLAATMYTLQYFDRSYRPEDLTSLMVPSTQGISVADVTRALQVHGLEASPRSGVRVEDLLASLTDQRIAILPTTVAGEKGHFYVVVRGKGSSFLLVDAGRSVKEQSVSEMQKRLRANGEVVVFVWVREQGEDARAVAIDPQEDDLGKIHSDTSQAKGKFTIRNDSARYILVTDVVPACSCTTSGWKRGLLAPGQEVPIEVAIRPGGVDVGRFKKTVVFRFADGSSQQARIVGECLGPEESQGIRVSPTEVYFDFGDAPHAQTRHLKVFGKGPVHVALQEADWASAQVTRQPGAEPGVIEILTDPNRTEDGLGTGVLQVWVTEQEPRVTVPLHAVRSKPYKVEGRIVTLARDQGSPSGVFIFRKDAQGGNDIHIEPITTGLNGIQLQPIQNEQESRLQVNVTDRGSLTSGLHPVDVHVRVGDAARKPYSERVYVLVR